MKIYFASFAVACFIGIIGLIAFFIVGFWSERGDLGIASGCLVYLTAGYLLTIEYPKSILYGGAAVNAPIWIVFIGPADPGQFTLYLPGLLATLGCAYTGTIAGRLVLRRRSQAKSAEHFEEPRTLTNS